MLSVRDLVRQIPAEWQENVKHRAQLSYGAFLDQISDPERTSRIGAWFWGVQEIPEILDRWGQDLSPAQVHLVTVPPPGGAPELLWKRFSQAFGLDGIDLDLQGERQNPSLGAPETTLLRRINRRANAELAPADYRPLVRELLAHQTLSRRTRSPRLALPPDLHPWVQELSASWIAEIEARGYDVVGDLGDLVGAPPVSEYADPDRPRERQVASAAVDAITALLLDNARLRQEEARLHAELADVRARARAGPRDPVVPAPPRDRRSPGGQSRRSCGARCLPAGAGQELAVGVAADLPGDVGVRTQPDEAAGDRDPPPDRRGQPLAGHLGHQLCGHLGGDQPVEVGSWIGAVAIAIGGAGSLRFLTSASTTSSPSIVVRIALRTLGSSRS